MPIKIQFTNSASPRRERLALLSVSFLLLAVSAFGEIEFPKAQDIDWLESYTPAEFEALCTKKQGKDENSPFSKFPFPSPEKFKATMREHQSIDQIRKWKLKDEVSIQYGEIWVAGWALFSKEDVVKRVPLRTAYRARKTI